MKSIDQRLERIESEEEIRIPVSDGVARTVKVKVPAWRDPADGEIYLDAEAIAILDKARARHLGVLAPQELSKLRKRLGLTQHEIADLLQIGDKTWTRWETGREVPSRSLNLLLMALYEGKIDIAYLRSKQRPAAQRAPEPVLCAQGWQQLLRAEHSLAWHEVEPGDDGDWWASILPAFATPERLSARTTTAVRMLLLSKWGKCGQAKPSKGERYSRSQAPFEVGSLDVGTQNSRTEKMPLSA
jgi:DNA-binding transcriptional regulator YiaG